ncbi:hypothetical protein L2E82_19459 [Cichorium intybus]|uniref:Uncharacterized protein n=1 Tax=Cichorium intybus TaxID=13427 RepID=A0ACB9FBG5_CICIN|nr:hypothetical protein L2E82_19459 [Cichorium intybus]
MKASIEFSISSAETSSNEGSPGLRKRRSPILTSYASENQNLKANSHVGVVKKKKAKSTMGESGEEGNGGG